MEDATWKSFQSLIDSTLTILLLKCLTKPSNPNLAPARMYVLYAMKVIMIDLYFHFRTKLVERYDPFPSLTLFRNAVKVSTSVFLVYHNYTNTK